MDSNSGLSHPYRSYSTLSVPRRVFSARRHHLFRSLPLYSVWPLFPRVYFLSFFLFLVPLDFLQICPTETEPEHLQVLTLKDVAGPKNVRSKHMRAVFIINQLYGPLMEVISAKFMLGAFFFFFPSPPSLAKQLRDSDAPPTDNAALAATSSKPSLLPHLHHLHLNLLAILAPPHPVE